MNTRSHHGKFRYIVFVPSVSLIMRAGQDDVRAATWLLGRITTFAHHWGWADQLLGYSVVAVLAAGCAWRLCCRPGLNLKNASCMLDSSMGSAVFVRDFTIVTANEAAVRTFGFASKLAIEGQDLLALLHMQDARVLQSQCAEHERSGDEAIFTPRGADLLRLSASPPRPPARPARSCACRTLAQSRSGD